MKPGPKPFTRSKTGQPRPISRLRERKCRQGHSRKDAFVAIDYRTGNLRLVCRECMRLRQKRYYDEGRLYRYT